MIEGTDFSDALTELEREERREGRRGYRAIERRAETYDEAARATLQDGNPRAAQVHATLAVSARLEALSYAIRHQNDA